MTSKKSRPLDDPPAASSSDEGDSDDEEEEEDEEQTAEKSQPKQPQSEDEDDEEESGSEREGEEDDEDDEEEQEEEQLPKSKKQQQNQPTSPPQVTTNSKKNPQPESDSESDSQKSPRASDFTIKPIKSPQEKSETPTPVSKPSAKRRAENGKVSKSSKKAKPSGESAGEDDGDAVGASTPAEKKFANHRLWSEEDEIAILKGLIEFQAKNRKDASNHQQEFHDFLKDSLHVEASKSQVMDKVRRLKKKFKTALEKSSNGEDPVFSKPHDHKTFQLSKKIWGNLSDKMAVDDAVANTTEKSSVREKPSSLRSSRKSTSDKHAYVEPNSLPMTTKDEDVDKVKFEKSEPNQGKEDERLLKYPFFMGAFRPDYISEMPIPEIVKSNTSLLGSSELKELDNKWKNQNAAEIELFLGRIELVREQARMVLDAINSSKN